MMVMVRNLVESEPLGPQQRVGEVDQQPRRHESGERIIENHGSLLRDVRRRRHSLPRARTGRGRSPARADPSFECLIRHAVARARCASRRRALACTTARMLTLLARGPYVAPIAICFRDGAGIKDIGISYRFPGTAA